MDEAKVVRIVILVTHQNSPIVLQPGEQSLDFPPPLVAPQLPHILRPGFLPVALVRRNHLYVERLKVSIQRVRIVCLVADQSFELLVGEALDESFAN